MWEWLKVLWGSNEYDRAEHLVYSGFPRVTFIHWSLHRFWLRRRWEIEGFGITSSEDAAKVAYMMKNYIQQDLCHLCLNQVDREEAKGVYLGGKKKEE